MEITKEVDVNVVTQVLRGINSFNFLSSHNDFNSTTKTYIFFTPTGIPVEGTIVL